MTQRIARFSRGEVLRASRLNEVMDVINVGLASPQDATEATSSSGIPGTTLTTWTEVSRSGNTVTLADSSVIVFGLCKGSADIIGIAPGGRFLAVEVKTKTGRVSPDQARFIEHVKAKGGVAGVARSVQDALDIINTH
jgi:hypothetical protein